MLDAGVECLIKKSPTFLSKFLRVFAILLDISLVLISIFITIFLTPYFAFVCVLIGAGWFITWLIYRYTYVEYEYSYFEGDFVVDKIYNKSRRKRVKRFNFNKVDRCALVSAQVFGNNDRDNKKMFDCSDNNYDTEDYIALVAEDNQTPFYIRFTPNEEMLEVLKKKYSRKFY